MNRVRTIIFILVFAACIRAEERIELKSVMARTHAKMPLLLGLIGVSDELTKVATILQHDLAFTGQFAVTQKTVDDVSSKDQVKNWLGQGYSLIIYLKPVDKGCEWRLYSTFDANMVAGKKVVVPNVDARALAHVVADELWPQLTGTQGFFSTKIVYGKEICKRGRHCKKYIYMRDATDAQGLTEQLLVASPTISVAPRWNRDKENPLVLYSEYTKTNVRLIAVNMQGKRKIVSNFDGVNMQVAYSPTGNSVVYCLSRSPNETFASHLTSQLYNYEVNPATRKVTFERLTSNQGNNFSPCWGPGDTIFYASDATPNGLPNICWYDLKTKKIAWLTQGVYATSPCYCPATNKLVYSRMVQKKMQLWDYDFATQIHRQLTFDGTDKDDCSWSPCGNLISYSAENNGKSRIAMFNLLTQQQFFLTTETEDCSYPAWSPPYAFSA